MLIVGGLHFLIGNSAFQCIHDVAEPFLLHQTVFGILLGFPFGITSVLLMLFLLDNYRIPAALIVVFGGILAGLLAGAGTNLVSLKLALGLPAILPFGFPDNADFTYALIVLVLPQIPITFGNAVFAYTDLSRQYFGEQSVRVANRNVCFSMALANVCSALVGGIPLCHGVEGLAAHYRSGARTSGANLIIGGFFLEVIFV